MPDHKNETITFKVDAALSQTMRGIPNRSEFIRAAILSALDHACPLCRGTGTLTPQQQDHWQGFSETHSLGECGNCQALHLVCLTEEEGK